MSSSYTKVSSTGGSSFTSLGRGRGAVKLAKGSGVLVGSDVAEAGFANSDLLLGDSHIRSDNIRGGQSCEHQLGLKFFTGPTQTMGCGDAYCSCDPSTYSRGSTSFWDKRA